MFSAGSITQVESSCTSPIVLVTKKDVRPRFCIAYRKLNAVMKRDRWPLPLIDEIIDEVKGSTFNTTLDLFQGYWQIKRHDSCKGMTTFICSGAVRFEEFKNNVLKDGGQFFSECEQWKCYVEDVVVHSASMEDHINHLEKFMSLLRKHELRVRLSKWLFMRPIVKLLGHLIDQISVHTDDNKVQKIREAQQPSDAKELRPFLGLAFYYRKFIKVFAKMGSP